MIALLLLGGITAALAAWSARDKTSGVDMGTPLGLPAMMGKTLDGKAGKYEEAKVPAGFRGPPLLPEEERLLSMLLLWVKDKKYPAGRKRYLNKRLALETAKLAKKLGLHGTARAILTDTKIPPNEKLGRRGVTVVEALLAYAKNKKPS